MIRYGFVDIGFLGDWCGQQCDFVMADGLTFLGWYGATMKSWFGAGLGQNLKQQCQAWVAIRSSTVPIHIYLSTASRERERERESEFGAI